MGGDFKGVVVAPLPVPIVLPRDDGSRERSSACINVTHRGANWADALPAQPLIFGGRL